MALFGVLFERDLISRRLRLNVRCSPDLLLPG